MYIFEEKMQGPQGSLTCYDMDNDVFTQPFQNMMFKSLSMEHWTSVQSGDFSTYPVSVCLYKVWENNTQISANAQDSPNRYQAFWRSEP